MLKIFFRRLLLATCVACTAFLPLLSQPAVAQGGVRLPNMGEPAEQTLSLREEIRIGEAFMRMVRARYDLVEDPLIQTSVSALGERLARSSTGSETGFTFFVVEDPSINAFAAPGGYVGIHTGLILAVENEAQLAAVVAHEIAHVTQRHLARAFSSAERSSLPTVAGIIAAILLGSVDPQASQAALATSIAANAQQQINYTRSNEQEADRVGISFLTDAGYDPAGMAEVFDLLRRANSLGSRAPAYLSTHPLSEARIAEARDRAEQLRQPEQIRDDLGFQQIKIRTAVLTERTQTRLSESLAQQAASSDGVRREMLLYGSVVAALQTRDPAPAREAVAELRALRPDDFNYQLADATLRFRSGDRGTAREQFEHLLQIYPLNFPVTTRYAQLLSETPGETQRAISLLKDYVRARPNPEPLIYRLLAAAYEKAGNRPLSLEALAEYHYLLGETGTAVQNLRTATKLVPADSEDQLRIAARLETLTRRAANALQQN